MSRHRPKRFYKQMDRETAEFIRELYFIGRHKQKDIGAVFGITQGSVSRIVAGLVWQ